MWWTHQTSDASSSASASAVAEKNLVFGDVDVSGGYGVGGTRSRTSHLPKKHDLSQLQGVVGRLAVTVQRFCMRIHARGGGCGVNNLLRQLTRLFCTANSPLHWLCTANQCDGSSCLIV